MDPSSDTIRISRTSCARAFNNSWASITSLIWCCPLMALVEELPLSLPYYRLKRSRRNWPNSKHTYRQTYGGRYSIQESSYRENSKLGRLILETIGTIKINLHFTTKTMKHLNENFKKYPLICSLPPNIIRNNWQTMKISILKSEMSPIPKCVNRELAIECPWIALFVEKNKEINYLRHTTLLIRRVNSSTSTFLD